MKTLKIGLVSGLVALSSMAHAGGLAPEVQQPITVIPAEPQSSASDYIVPLLFLALIAAAASSGSDDAETATNGNGEES